MKELPRHFQLRVDPVGPIPQGGTGRLAFHLAREPGYIRPVRVTLQNLTPEISPEPKELLLHERDAEGSITLHVGAATTTGSHTFAVVGTSLGGNREEVQATLVTVGASWTLDRAFGTEGLTIINGGRAPSDLIVDGVRVFVATPVLGKPTVIALDERGQEDLAWGTAGRYEPPCETLPEAPAQIVRNERGSLSVYTTALQTGTPHVAVAPLGAPSCTFVAIPGPSIFSRATVDARGRTLLAFLNQGGLTSSITRLVPDGTIDPTFGTAGRIDIPGSSAIDSLRVLADGDLILAGREGSDPSIPAFFHLSPDGAIPPNGPPDGKLITSAPRGYGSVQLLPPPSEGDRSGGRGYGVWIPFEAGLPVVLGSLRANAVDERARITPSRGTLHGTATSLGSRFLIVTRSELPANLRFSLHDGSGQLDPRAPFAPLSLLRGVVALAVAIAVPFDPHHVVFAGSSLTSLRANATVVGWVWRDPSL